MRIPRIYTDASLLRVDTSLVLDKEASNHVSRVLRLAIGATVELFNGDGFSYFADICDLERNRVEVQIKEQFQSSSESPLHIHLFQGVSRGDKMDLTLQKGVELGVAEFTPIMTERCGVKLDEKRWLKKIEHWQKVIISACEQSRRNTIPRLNPVISFNESLSDQSGVCLFLDPDATDSLRDLPTPTSDEAVNLWIGPEGGFSDNEMEQAKQAECSCIQLGPRVLRTETAALATVSAINIIWGDF